MVHSRRALYGSAGSHEPEGCFRTLAKRQFVDKGVDVCSAGWEIGMCQF